MSDWPGAASLHGRNGELVAVHVTVEPRMLEGVLDALAEAPFPINPEIRHRATQWVTLEGGRRELRPAAMVEFPVKKIP